ncbi:unnamed protein product [Ceutorhynchus assimilis]|uniref:FLYWCH-type domain-containing protein n=1 Tax=Ceutorhynchus assimilis TaxID=467358 RepID=A0A9N9MHG3_9CUCU|nr:unnamed protein product [Ceutorhynchus assimilis]
MARYVVDGFVFHVNNISKGNPRNMYLRCLEYKRLGCHARAEIPFDGSSKNIKVSKSHNHTSDICAEEKVTFMRDLKEVLLKNPTVPNRTIYQTLAEMSPNAAGEIPFESIRRKMNRWRRENNDGLQQRELIEKQ